MTDALPAIEEVLVCGAGAIGREVALQCAMCGYRVTLYDVSRPALKQAKAAIELARNALARTYAPETARVLASRVYYTTAIDEATAGADFVSECIPEDLALKRRLFAELGERAPAHAIFTTNSSSFLPSELADASGRPDRFLALHFHKPVWVASVVDIMPHVGTVRGVVERVTQFARSLRQLPIVLGKESRDYVFNAMLQAYIAAALSLWTREVASFEDIDRTWMIAEGASRGPFGVMDAIGLDTIHDVVRSRPDGDWGAAVLRLKRDFLDRGHLGVKSGEGFYRYPNPRYREAGFLKP